MGSTSKPAQDGKLFLGYGKLSAVAASGEILAYFKYMSCFLLSLAAQMTDRFVSKIQDVAFIGPFISVRLMPGGARGPDRKGGQSSSRCKSAQPETLLIDFSCRVGPPLPCCWYLTTLSQVLFLLQYVNCLGSNVIKREEVQSSILSLHAVCVGNNSITLSKAELQAGIIGPCFTILHNQGPVSCIWSAVP